MNKRREFFYKTTLLTVGLFGFVGVAGRAFAIPKKVKLAWNGIERTCVITCPVCKDKVREVMTRENVKRVYHCPNCLTWLSPLEGDHCIYDSYGSVNCPSTQLKIKERLRLGLK